MLPQALSDPEDARRRQQGLRLMKDPNLRNLPDLSLALLSTFNVDLLPPFMVEALERAGLSPNVYLSEFSQLVPRGPERKFWAISSWAGHGAYHTSFGRPTRTSDGRFHALHTSRCRGTGEGPLE